MKRIVEQVVRAAMLLDKLRLPTESRQRIGRWTGLQIQNTWEEVKITRFRQRVDTTSAWFFGRGQSSTISLTHWKSTF